MRIKYLKLVGLLLVSAVTFIACSSAEDPTKAKDNGDKKSASSSKKLQIGWVFAMANAPILIAKEKGYYKEVGLDVELSSFTSGPRVRKGLLSGKLDMAYIGAPPVYHWYAKGLKSKILAKVNYGQAAVIVHGSSEIKDLEGLRGKKIAGVKIGSGMDVLLRGYVIGEAGKMDPLKDLEIRPMKPGSMGSAIAAKTVQGAFCWEPFTSKYVLKGTAKVILDMNKEIPKYPWYVVMAVPKAMKEKRAQIVLALKAHKKAIDFLNSSPTAGNDILIKAFSLKSVTDASGKVHTATDILKLARTRIGWEAELTNDDTGFIQRLMDYSNKLRYMDKKLRADELIDKSFMQEAMK